MKLSELKTGEKSLALIAFLYIAGFGGYYVFSDNLEFLWYVAVLLFFFGLIFFTVRRSHFDFLTLCGLTIWGFMHMAGGGIHVHGDVLYRLHVIPIIGTGDAAILKYDQIVHAFGFFVAAIALFHLVRPYLNERTNWKVIYPFIAAGSMGLGALNEVVEFIPVLVLSDTGVGGYFNTALDLCFNMFGAICAIVFIHFYYHPTRKS